MIWVGSCAARMVGNGRETAAAARPEHGWIHHPTHLQRCQSPRSCAGRWAGVHNLQGVVELALTAGLQVQQAGLGWHTGQKRTANRHHIRNGVP